MRQRYLYGAIAIILTVLCFFTIAALWAEERPPFQVQDPAIAENFRRIYELVDQIRENDGAHVFVSSGNSTQLINADVVASSVTIAAGTSVIIAPAGLKAGWLPMITEMDTSSKTVSVQMWTSSFTLTNTSGSVAKTVNWWLFGRK